MATYKRSILIVEPKFQYKFCFFVCSLVFLSSLMYPATIYELAEKLIHISPESNASRNMESLAQALIGIQIAWLGIIFVITIFVSHKIAGPVYKLKSYLSALREGKEYSPLFFRNGDNFQELADEVNSFIEHVRAKRTEDFKYLDEVSAYIANLSLVIPEDKKPVLNEALSKIAEMQNRNV